MHVNARIQSMGRLKRAAVYEWKLTWLVWVRFCFADICLCVCIYETKNWVMPFSSGFSRPMCRSPIHWVNSNRWFEYDIVTHLNSSKYLRSLTGVIDINYSNELSTSARNLQRAFTCVQCGIASHFAVLCMLAHIENLNSMLEIRLRCYRE